MDLFGVGACLVGSLVAFQLRRQAWGIGLLALTLGGGALFLVAGRMGYLRFQPDAGSRPSPPYPLLAPDTELLIRASGCFSIRDQVRYLVEHPTVLTTPRSREHILMAELHRSRLLLLGQSRPSDWGWWYQFFRPEAIEQVVLGAISHGWRPRLALKVCYRAEDEKGEQEIAETILSFDDEMTRTLAWADLTQEMRAAASSR
jgi:hypothetical protein